ncbi:hypothetical protein SASPL_142315 [Salvia splendens]|uniref:non-specific serine/threonine protein kinase n=2 Tax=Salvia splendens TaxID=180675 RepID=A0A8X8WJI7_SALSN|nr:hypothetical protein SASPL_142315 [Salvia splendens]
MSTIIPIPLPSLPPSGSDANQTTSTPPPASAPPPSSTSSPPPPESAPPPAPSSPPPSPPQSPPPPPETPPPALPSALPPSPPPSPPSPVSPPPSSPAAPPPADNSPPSPVVSPSPPPPSPPPPLESSPPKESPVPPVAPQPPPPAVSPSSPPPAEAAPPTASPPPPPVAHSPKHSPPPPPTGSPPISPISSPPPDAAASPPPTPSSTFSPTISPSAPPHNTSSNGTHPASPLPSIPTEKPTAGSTQNSPNITADVTPRSAGLRAGGAAGLGILVGFLALSLVVLAVWYTSKRKRRKDQFRLNYAMPSPFASSQNSDSSFLKSQYSSQLAGSISANNYYSPDGGLNTSRSWFTYQDLSEATNGFSEDNILGEGGFGCVYKGTLVDGRVVAVKQLKDGGGQGEREFRAEVEIISRIHHRHLVSLVGYCISEQQRLLVYDYVPNNTLHHHLHCHGTVMDWASRVKAATGAARGLAYLHED